MTSALEAFLYAALEELSAPDGPVGPVAGPVKRNPDDALLRLARSLSARQLATCAWWCCTPTAGSPDSSSSRAYLVERYSGCRS